jgi:DNA-directed RNA polymerase specialized sigma24 family protein
MSCRILVGVLPVLATAANTARFGATLRATTTSKGGRVTNATLLSLNSEWADLLPRSGPTVAIWAARCPELAGVADLADILTHVRTDSDAVLGALLRLGADGDRLAWRVVLQAMLGKVVLLSAGADERLSEAVSELWVAIAEYPLDRRPRSIAANLSWTLRRRLAKPVPAALPAPITEPGAAQTLDDALALGLLDTRTHHTLWLVYVVGLNSARAAETLGTTPELVRYHCSRSLRRLAEQAELLAA